MITQKSATKQVFETNVEDGGEVFGISSSAKIFNMLISGLYENKVQSIVREVFSNAYDSHVEAGHPEKPFDVTLPTMFDGTFRVRDYGVSIDHETAVTLYKTLGESTKEDQENPIGKWGIGSKSPFAYTDSFNVIAYLDGEMRVYSCVINDREEPTITTIATMPTDEPNGLEVSFAVQPEDIRAFQRAVKRVGFGFEVKPNVNDGEWEWYADNPSFEGDGWKLYMQNPFDPYRAETFVRMGPVLYPVNADALNDHINTEQREMLQYTLIFDVPMGSCEPTPSRESLQYSKRFKTIETISGAIQVALDELIDKAIEKVQSMPTRHEAAIALGDAQNNHSSPRFLRRYLEQNGVTYEGTPLHHVWRDQKVYMRVRSLGYSDWKRKRMAAPSDSRAVAIKHEEGQTFYLDDCSTKRNFERIKEHFTSNKDVENAYWVRVNPSRKSDALNLIRLMEEFDSAEFVNVADIELLKIARERRSYSAPKVDVYDEVGHVRSCDLSAEEFEAGGYYTRMERGCCVENYSSGAATQALISLDVLDDDKMIIRIPKTYWKRFEKAEQWEPLENLVEENRASPETVQRIVENAEMDAKCAAIRGNLSGIAARLQRDKRSKWVGMVSEIGTIADFSDWYSKVSVNTIVLSDEDQHFKRLEMAVNSSQFDVKDGLTTAAGKEACEWCDLIDTQYPMLNLLLKESGWMRWCQKDIDTVVDYVTMMSNKNETNQAVAIAA